MGVIVQNARTTDAVATQVSRAISAITGIINGREIEQEAGVSSCFILGLNCQYKSYAQRSI